MSKYTPKSWFSSGRYVVEENKAIGEFRNRFGDFADDKISAKRAKIASAAPELLEALKLALEHLDTLYPTARGDDFLVDTCVAAIAKATGEAP